MPDYNKVMLMGRLTRDIELKHINSGTAVAQVGLAIGRRYKGKDGETKQETTYVDCEAWGRTAEVMHQYLAKGKPVFIEGRLNLASWTTKDGQKRSKLKVIIESCQFIDGGKGGGSGGSSVGSSSGGESGVSEEDAPF